MVSFSGAALSVCSVSRKNCVCVLQRLVATDKRNTAFFTMYTMYTVQTTMYTLHFTHYTVNTKLYTLHCTHYTVHTALHTLHYTHYNIHSTLHTLHCAHYTVLTTLSTKHSLKCTVDTKLYTLHSTHYTVHNTVTMCTKTKQFILFNSSKKHFVLRKQNSLAQYLTEGRINLNLKVSHIYISSFVFFYNIKFIEPVFKFVVVEYLAFCGLPMKNCWIFISLTSLDFLCHNALL